MEIISGLIKMEFYLFIKVSLVGLLVGKILLVESSRFFGYRKKVIFIFIKRLVI